MEHKKLEGLKDDDQPIEEPWLATTFVLVKEEWMLQKLTSGIGLNGFAEVAEIDVNF